MTKTAVPHLTAPDRVGSACRRVARRVDAPRLPQGAMTPPATVPEMCDGSCWNGIRSATASLLEIGEGRL